MTGTDAEPLDLRLALPAAAAWLTAWQGRLLPPDVLLALSGVCAAGALVLLGRSKRTAALVAAACLACAGAAGVATAARKRQQQQETDQCEEDQPDPARPIA